MARLLYLDTFSGVSGDMFLGALLDAGLSLEALEAELAGLGLDDYELQAKKVFRGAFHATRLKVKLLGAAAIALEPPRGQDDSQQDDDPHDHHHQHHHHHHHDHDHDHDHGHAHEGQRNFRDIVELLRKSKLPREVIEATTGVFERLGRAEAKVHGASLDEVHFHEVGAVDSIVDITGSCLGLHMLGIDEVYSSPLTVGSGFAHGAHGTFPLPAPATAEIVRGFPVRQRETGFELTTPTGAALATALAKEFGTLPDMEVSVVGYGAGDDRPLAVPNVLRVFLGESTKAGQARQDRVVLLETNVDDMNPQWLGYVMDRLFDKGALDVTVTPLLMKKSRSAQRISVLARPGDEAPLEEILFSESTTFGIRKQEIDRIVLERKSVPVETPWGSVRVKVGHQGKKILSAEPEYEDLRQAAKTSGKPLKEIHRIVLERFHAGG